MTGHSTQSHRHKVGDTLETPVDVFRPNRSDLALHVYQLVGILWEHVGIWEAQTNGCVCVCVCVCVCAGHVCTCVFTDTFLCWRLRDEYSVLLGYCYCWYDVHWVIADGNAALLIGMNKRHRVWNTIQSTILVSFARRSWPISHHVRLALLSSCDGDVDYTLRVCIVSQFPSHRLYASSCAAQRTRLNEPGVVHPAHTFWCSVCWMNNLWAVREGKYGMMRLRTHYAPISFRLVSKKIDSCWIFDNVFTAHRLRRSLACEIVWFLIQWQWKHITRMDQIRSHPKPQQVRNRLLTKNEIRF